MNSQESGRATVLAPDSESPSQEDPPLSGLLRGSGDQGIHTPPPSRPRSRSVVVGDEYHRLSSPASGTAVNDKQDEHNMDMHEKMWIDVVRGPKCPADFSSPNSGLDKNEGQFEFELMTSF